MKSEERRLYPLALGVIACMTHDEWLKQVRAEVAIMAVGLIIIAVGAVMGLIRMAM